MTSKEESKKLERAAMDSLVVEKSKDMLSELGQLMLDDDLKDDVLEQLPILRYRGIYKSIRDAFFFNKFCKFLEGVANVSIDKRTTYIGKLSDDEIVENGKYLVNYIDRLDDESKPEIAGNIFSAFIAGVISKEEMFRFNYIVDKIFVLDLIELQDSVKNQQISDDLSLRIAPLGITNYEIRDPARQQALRSTREIRAPIGEVPQPKIASSFTEIGIKFLQIALGVKGVDS